MAKPGWGSCSSVLTLIPFLAVIWIFHLTLNCLKKITQSNPCGKQLCLRDLGNGKVRAEYLAVVFFYCLPLLRQRLPCFLWHLLTDTYLKLTICMNTEFKYWLVRFYSESVEFISESKSVFASPILTFLYQCFYYCFHDTHLLCFLCFL